MKTSTAAEFVRTARLPTTADEAFAWHRRPGAFERLTPPWESTRVLSRSGGVEPGGRLTLESRVGPARLQWEVEHRAPEGGAGFADVQLRGPFAAWRHDHLFRDEAGGESTLEDRIRFALPAAAFPRGVFLPPLRARLDRLFTFRHRTLVGDLAVHAGARATRRRVLVSGSTGLVGNTLACFLSTGGHDVVRLARPASRAGEPGLPRLEWDPVRGFDAAALETLASFDAVVHLAGENLAGGPWTAARKRRILESRVGGTRALAETLARLPRPPRVLVCASAVGWYGDRGDELVDETSGPGSGFLADVCREWEAAAQPAREAGIRVVWMRFGVVVSGRDGALPKMATPFRLGLGGVLGNGRQYFSWIALDDVIGAIHHALLDERLAGPVNAVSPNAVTNRELTRTLGRVLGRPTFFPVPAFALRLLLGEMANEMLLSGARVAPRRLEETGFTFRHPELEGALRHELGRAASAAPRIRA